MQNDIKRNILMSMLLTLLMLAFSGCSVFISTPEVAHFKIQRPDNKFIEYAINLDDPCETNVDLHLSDRHTIQFDFKWIWGMDERSEIYSEIELHPNTPLLTPWMMCNYSFE